MWFGTKDGLNRFDGVSFRSYRDNPLNKQRIGNTFIRTIIEYDKNTLWIGTDEGIYIYDHNQEVFHKFDLKTESGVAIVSPVNGLLKAADSTVWIATLGQGVFKLKAGGHQELQLDQIHTGNHAVSSDYINDVY